MEKIIKFNDEYAYRTAFTETVSYAAENELLVHDINKNAGRMYDKENINNFMISVLHPYKTIKIEGKNSEKVNLLESKLLKIKEKEDTPDKIPEVA